MLGIRFYREHNTPADKRKRKPSGNVFARFVDVRPFPGSHGFLVEGIGALFDRPDSPCCGTSASISWLASHCTRIGEAEAREIHPQLFVYLDD